MERKPGWWFSPHMAAASRAIFEWIPLVDLVLIVRDARIPLSSECVDFRAGDWLRSKSIVVLNEMDLANRSQIKEWLRHFEMKNRHCFAVNAHNTDSIKQGAISDGLVGVKELAQYFLSVLNSSEEYKKWEKLLTGRTDCLVIDSPGVSSSGSNLEIKRIRRYPSDHTQDFIIQDVRRTLFEEISSHQISQDANDSTKLIEMQMTALREAFWIPSDLNEKSCLRVSRKLLDLYHTGTLYI